MSDTTVHGVHLENTTRGSDKYYRVLAVGSARLVVMYGPRGRVPGASKVTDGYPHGELTDAVHRKRLGGYETVVELRYSSALPGDPSTWTPAEVAGEFDTRWADRVRPAQLALEAAGDAGDLAVVHLPAFTPPRGKVGGTRDARPWGATLAAALLHTREDRDQRATYAVVAEAVATWVQRNYPGSSTAPLPGSADPAVLLSSVVEMTRLNPSWSLGQATELAAAVHA